MQKPPPFMFDRNIESYREMIDITHNKSLHTAIAKQVGLLEDFLQDKKGWSRDLSLDYLERHCPEEKFWAKPYFQVTNRKSGGTHSVQLFGGLASVLNIGKKWHGHYGRPCVKVIKVGVLRVFKSKDLESNVLRAFAFAESAVEKGRAHMMDIVADPRTSLEGRAIHPE